MPSGYGFRSSILRYLCPTKNYFFQYFWWRHCVWFVVWAPPIKNPGYAYGTGHVEAWFEDSTAHMLSPGQSNLQKCYYSSKLVITRGGVEDRKLEAKAKDTKKFRGQGQTLSRPRPRTKDTDASVLQKKRPLKFFFRRSLDLRKPKKVFADFPQGFWRFPTKFQRFKNSAVLEPSTGQFSRTWGFEAKAKDFKMCPRGQGRLWGLHLW